MREAQKYRWESKLKSFQRTKDQGFFVKWHNFESYAVPLAKRSLFYTAMLVF